MTNNALPHNKLLGILLSQQGNVVQAESLTTLYHTISCWGSYHRSKVTLSRQNDEQSSTTQQAVGDLIACSKVTLSKQNDKHGSTTQQTVGDLIVCNYPSRITNNALPHNKTCSRRGFSLACKHSGGKLRWIIPR